MTTAILIGEIAGIDRFASDAKLARIAGCAPVPISSGRSDRHRLDSGGNRQLNYAIHIIAVTKLRTDPATAVYIAKQRRNGKTQREAIRCLKRHVVRLWAPVLPVTLSRTQIRRCLYAHPARKFRFPDPAGLALVGD